MCWQENRQDHIEMLISILMRNTQTNYFLYEKMQEMKSLQIGVQFA